MFTKNEIPLFDSSEPNLQLNSDALAKWQDELAKSQMATISPPKSAQSLDTSIILATHKIIPAHVSGMVPFGTIVYLLISFIYFYNLNELHF